MEKASKSRLFLLFEPAENTSEIGLKDSEPSLVSQLVVAAITADSLEEAASSIGGILETREGKESIVWLPEGLFEEMWNGKRYTAGKTPKKLEKGFQGLFWRVGPRQEISLGLICPLRSLKPRQGARLGLAIKEIPLLAPYGVH